MTDVGRLEYSGFPGTHWWFTHILQWMGFEILTDTKVKRGHHIIEFREKIKL